MGARNLQNDMTADAAMVSTPVDKTVAEVCQAGFEEAQLALVGAAVVTTS